jgi:hypothetical protein
VHGTRSGKRHTTQVSMPRAGYTPCMPARSEALLDEIRAEFPGFAVVRKRDSRLQRAIHVALMALTLGGQRVYLTGYYTAMFGKLWVPDSWDALADLDRYILLRHERVHLRQRRRWGDVLMAFIYLVPFFPLFLAYGRARIEWEAYTETIRATFEVYGKSEAEKLRPKIIKRFVGGEYGWMWPFPRVVERWFDEVLRELYAAK